MAFRRAPGTSWYRRLPAAPPPLAHFEMCVRTGLRIRRTSPSSPSSAKVAGLIPPDVINGASDLLIEVIVEVDD